VLVRVEIEKLEVVEVLGLLMPWIWNETALVRLIVELNPFRIVKVLDAVL